MNQTTLNPYLSFNGNCREALNFYRDCLGGDLSLLAVEDSPMHDQWPEEVQKLILHGRLENGAVVLTGSDLGGAGFFLQGNTISLSLQCEDEEEIRRFFEKLSSGAKITHRLHRFFDGTIGALTDRYGMNWILSCSLPQNVQLSNSETDDERHENN